VFLQGNILINDDGIPVLTDFGLSKVDNTYTSHSLHGHGSRRWSAPELFDGGSKTKASDVYAVALVISEVSPRAYLTVVHLFIRPFLI